MIALRCVFTVNGDKPSRSAACWSSDPSPITERTICSFCVRASSVTFFGFFKCGTIDGLTYSARSMFEPIHVLDINPGDEQIRHAGLNGVQCVHPTLENLHLSVLPKLL